MNLFLLSTIASGVACAPLLISALSPKFTSVQNIKGSNYNGAIPPPWITGGYWGSPYRPYGGYGSNQAPPPPPPPPQVNFEQNIPPSNGLGQQSNGPNPPPSNAESQPNQLGAIPPAGSQGALSSSESNIKDPKAPVNDSATFGDNSPPPTFQFNP